MFIDRSTLGSSTIEIGFPFVSKDKACGSVDVMEGGGRGGGDSTKALFVMNSLSFFISTVVASKNFFSIVELNLLACVE